MQKLQNKLKDAFIISRPRFWMYLIGPYIVGYVGSINTVADFFRLEFWLYFIYFSIPANFFLYAINDLADQDTDTYNEKKDNYEQRINTGHFALIRMGIIFHTVFTIILLFTPINIWAKAYLSLLWLLSVMYSCKPFRFKALPFIDSVSNVLYILPGLFAVVLNDKNLLLWLVLSCWMWASAMHLFSAIPDIDADKKAKLTTTAVLLGYKKSLLLCAFLWTCAPLLVLMETGIVEVLPFLLYGVISLYLLFNKRMVMKVYTYFPYINVFMGFYLFWLIYFIKF